MELIIGGLTIIIALIGALVVMMLRAIAVWKINHDNHAKWTDETLGLIVDRINRQERKLEGMYQ